MEAVEISFIPDICGVFISRHVLGAKGVARHVCEKSIFANEFVSKVPVLLSDSLLRGE